MKNTQSRFFLKLDEAGSSILAISAGLGVIALVGSTTLTTLEKQRLSARYMRATSARDSLEISLRKRAGSPSTLRNSLAVPANTELRNCVIGGATCTATASGLAVSHPVVLMDAMADRPAIGGSDTAPVRYDINGKRCDVDWANCLIEVVTTFRAECDGGAATCLKAKSVQVDVRIRNREGKDTQLGLGGRLSSFSSIAIEADPRDILVADPFLDEKKFDPVTGFPSAESLQEELISAHSPNLPAMEGGTVGTVPSSSTGL